MATGTVQRGPQATPPARKSTGQWLEYDQFIDKQLRKTRGQVKGVELAGVLMTLAAGSLVYFLAVSLVDHWLITGGLGIWGRLFFFALFVVGAVVYIAKRLAPLVIMRINPVYAAETIEKSKPSLKNALINFLFLRNEPSGVPQVVYQAVEEQAASSLQRTQVEAAVDRTRVIRIGYVLLAIVAVFAIYKLFSPKDPINTVGRIVMPWADIDAPTRVTIANIQPGSRTAYLGESVEISAEVHGIDDDEPVRILYTTKDRQTVDEAVVMLRSPDGLRHAGKIPPGESGIQQDIEYRIEAGDATSQTYWLSAAAAPTIAIQSIDYEYPAYTGRAKQHVTNTGDIQALEGTKVTFHGWANQPLHSAQIVLEGESGQVEQPIKVDDRAVTATLVLAFDEDHSKQQFTRYQLRPDGRKKPEPAQYKIIVDPDLAPEVKFLAPENDEVSVPANGKLTIEVRAQDPDFALGEVVLSAELGEKSLFDIKLLSKRYVGPFVAQYVFDPAKLGLKERDSVNYWATAKDVKQPRPNDAHTIHRQIRIVKALARKPSDEQRADDKTKNPDDQNPPQENRPGDERKNDNPQQQNENHNPKQGANGQNEQQPKQDNPRDAGQNPDQRRDSKQPDDGTRDNPNPDNKNQPNERPNREKKNDNSGKQDEKQPNDQGDGGNKQEPQQKRDSGAQGGSSSNGGGGDSKQNSNGDGASGKPDKSSPGKPGDSKTGQQTGDSSPNGQNPSGANPSGGQQTSDQRGDPQQQPNHGAAGQQGGADGTNESSAAKTADNIRALQNALNKQPQQKPGEAKQDQPGQAPKNQDSSNQNPGKQNPENSGKQDTSKPDSSKQNPGNQKTGDQNQTNPGQPQGNQSSQQPNGGNPSGKPQPGGQQNNAGSPNKTGAQGDPGASPNKQNGADNADNANNGNSKSPSANPKGSNGPEPNGQPGNGAKPGEKPQGDKSGQKSNDSKQPGEGSKPNPGDATKPSEGSKPSDGNKPSSAQKPGDEKNRGGQQRSGEKPNGDKTNAGEKSTQPGDRSKPDNTAGQPQPGSKSQPGDSPMADKSGNPNGAQPDGAKPDGAKPDGSNPQGDKPDGTKPDGTKPDGAKPNGADKTSTDKRDSTAEHGENKSGQPNDPSKKGDGAQTKAGTPPNGDKQDQPGDASKQNPDAKGGDAQSPKGNPGAGQKSTDKTGSPSPQEGSKPTENKTGDKGSEKESDSSDNAKSPSTSPKESNSEGSQDGDRSGGGKKGGGQQSKKEGTGGAGSHTAADEGSNSADGPGKGEKSTKPGNDKPSDKPTGQAGNEKGNGSTASDKAGEQGTPSNKPGDKDSQPGGGVDGPGGMRKGELPDGSAPDTSPLAGDEANKDFANKQFDLALDSLKKGNPDVLKELNWSADDARKLAERLEQMKSAAKQDPQGEAAKKMDELVRSLGDRAGQLTRRADGANDKSRGLQESKETGPPADYLEQFEAFRQGTLRGGK